MGTIQFGHPEFLPCLPVAAVAAATACILWFRRRTAILRFFAVNPGRVYGGKRVAFFLVAFCLLVVGTALVFSGPYIIVKKEQDVFEPLVIVIAQDISKSMLAPISSEPDKERTRRQRDPPCPPTRLQVAKQEVMSFMEVLERQQTDKVGLVVFARYAYPAIPVPTDDYPLFRRRFEKEILLENVLTMAEGSNHWAGVERALQVFDVESGYRKICIVVTDGEPVAPADILAQSKTETLAARKRSKDVRVYVLGVGEPGTASPVPLMWRTNGCPEPGGGYMKQTAGPGKGATMLTRIDPERLLAFADDLSGTYIQSVHGADLAESLEKIVKRERVKTGVKHETALIDITEPLLWLLLGLLAVLVILKTP